MAILVTGAFGRIGSRVARELLASGERPVLYDIGEVPWRLRMSSDQMPSAALP